MLLLIRFYNIQQNDPSYRKNFQNQNQNQNQYYVPNKQPNQ